MANQGSKGRREDRRLVTGDGRYTSDHSVEGQTVGYFLRADRAHARILRLEVASALARPGVVGILTGVDVADSGFKNLPALNFFKGVEGTSLIEPFRSALARDRVRFVGEPIALIVAETEFQAQDAAELIEIEYDDLPVLVDAKSAANDGDTLLHQHMRSNVAFEYEYGDRAATERAFKSAALVVELDINAERIAGNPMEPKSCLAHYLDEEGAFDVYLPSQGTADLRSALVGITGLDRSKIRLHSRDIGGAFGVRNEIYPEFLALMIASRKFGRPVKWTGSRSETIASDHHGRAASMNGRLAIDGDGHFLGVQFEWFVNMGAFCSNAGALINTVAAPTTMATSIYNVPAVFGLHHLVFTNTTPTTAYRGAARPNVAHMWERLIDEAALTTGIDRIEIRRRNLLKAHQFPYRTPTGSLYDSADPEGLLDAALAKADWNGFEARREQSSRAGKLRGIGCATFLEPSGGAGQEEIKISVGSDGRLQLFANVGPSGQGHETVFPKLVASILGISADRIDLRYNDNASPRMAGTGSIGSRSLISHGNALKLGAKVFVEKAKELAATELEVTPDDLTFQDGIFRVVGTDLNIELIAVIDKAATDPARPLDMLHAVNTAATFPSATHIAEVEIDPETGHVEVARYVAVDDCGVVYDHVIVDGQIQGGLMQGIGQVLGERVAYDPDTGQLLSATFMDYFMPRAAILPEITLVDRAVPSPFNDLGAKGAGEAGATGAVPALTNAVIHALKPFNVHGLELPFTPARIWAAIREAETRDRLHR